MERITLDVSGMSCATCASNIEEALDDLDGVDSGSANFATDEVTVEFDPERVSTAAIHEAIEEAGYEPRTETVTVEVGGMSCATCSESVETAAEGVPGVVEASANFATDEATITYDPSVTGLSAVDDAIEEAGYEPARESDEDEETGERAIDREVNKQRRLVLGGGVLTAPFLLVMVDMFVDGFLPEAVLGLDLGWVEFALATALMATLGKEFLVGAWRAWTNNRQANMDTLVTMGTSVAYVYSTVALLGLLTVDAGLYFEAVAFILWFITVGNWLEARSKAKAGNALRQLLEMEADEATVVEGYDDDPSERTVPLEDVEVGDVLKVRPGEKVPTDGVVLDGESAVDESMVTGESVPVEKSAGDEVIGSTINEQGVLYVEATKVGEDTAIQQIVERVKEAQARQPDVQRLVDRVSAVFVPAVIANAVFWAILWYLFPEALAGFVESLPLWGLVGGGPVAGGVPLLEFAMVVLASAILIACPCALGLATPAATMVGSTVSARNGVLFGGGDVLEQSRGVDAVVFDKTGTLTQGEMELTDVVAVDRAADGGELADEEQSTDGGAVVETTVDEETVLAAAASAERGSEHPIAEAIVAGARERGVAPEDPDSFEAIPGHGIRANTDYGEVLVGTRKLLRDEGIDSAPIEAEAERLEREGKTATLVALDGAAVGVLAVADTVRDSARETVADLRERGLAVYMLTGDNERTARAVAREVGIPEENVRAEVLPDEKADAIEAIQSDGTRAMMVGDGVNDAPALTTAAVGVAIGSGTDVAIESADVTLMRDDPADVLKALRVADATIRKVYQNLFWALVYNATLIPIASLGLLDPALAGLAMAASSVSVMTNSLAFVGYDPHEDYHVLPLRPFVG
ncbi:heavy metal translocating P-type ATPase [Halobacteriales archaeon QS_1_68_20]|nr:MAG: heavy metal translocating P-type ATPase [Halobacteriales archaeon QS_1_68_20]